MAISLDSVGSGGTGTGPGPLTVTHDGAAGARAFLAVEARYEGYAPTISAVTYDGNTMSLVGTISLNNVDTLGKIWVYEYDGIPSGSKTLSYTVNGGYYCSAATISYTGVDTVTFQDTNYGASITVTIDGTCTTGEWLLGVLANSGYYAMGTPTGGTNRAKISNGNMSIALIDATADATFSAGFPLADYWGAQVILLAPAAGTPEGATAGDYGWAATASGVNGEPGSGTASGTYTWAGAASGDNGEAPAEVTYGSVGDGVSSSADDPSFTHVIVGDGLLVALNYDGATHPAPTSVTVGATEVPLIDDDNYNAGLHIAVYGLLDPPTGSQTITINGDGGTSELIAVSASYIGAGSFGTPVFNWAGYFAAAPNVTADSDTNHRVFNAIFAASTLASYNQTQRDTPGGTRLVGDAAGAATVEFTATCGNYPWAAVAVDIIPATTPAEGTCSGGYGWAGSAIGANGENGLASGTYTWAATSTGYITVTGAATGAYGWAGTADSTTPLGPLLALLADNQPAFVVGVGDSTYVGWGDGAGGWPWRLYTLLAKGMDVHAVQYSWSPQMIYDTPTEGATTLGFMTIGGIGQSLDDYIAAYETPLDQLTTTGTGYAPFDTATMPALVLIWTGFNDLGQPASADPAVWSTYAANMHTFIDDLRAIMPDTHIVIFTQHFPVWIPGEEPVVTVDGVELGNWAGSYFTGQNAMVESFGLSLPLHPAVQRTNEPNVWIVDSQQAVMDLYNDYLTEFGYDTTYAFWTFLGVHPNGRTYTQIADWMASQLAPEIAPHWGFGVFGNYGWAGTAEGGMPPATGAGSGAYLWDSSATGAATKAGAVSSGYGWAGTASGIRACEGGAAGVFGWASSTAGHAPTVGGSEGSTASSYDFTGAAAGTRTSRGSADADYGWAATTSGRTSPAGLVASVYAWAATAAGIATPTPSSAAAGQYGWTAAAVSGASHLGAAAGAYTWIATAAAFSVAIATMTLTDRGAALTLTDTPTATTTLADSAAAAMTLENMP